jgi:hypothetical protein
VGKFGVGARRQADGRITIAKGGLQRGAQLHRIEQAANVGFAEMKIRHGLKFRGGLILQKLKRKHFEDHERTVSGTKNARGAG